MLNRLTLKKLASSKQSLRKRSLRGLALCGLWIAPLAMATPCQAGPWFDSLFGLTPRDPAAVARTSYANPGASCNNCGQANCQQTVVQYLPQVAYRTVWEPIPVTTYRRTVSYNPANGLPMTCTQPCTSYTYQARRVPYTTFRPVYAQVPVPTAPAYAAPAAAPVMAPVATPNCNCNGAAAPAGYTTAALAYPGAAYTAANPSTPSYAAPAYSAGSSYAAPSYASPASATAPTGIAQADPPGATAWEPVSAAGASPYAAPTPASAPSAGSYGAPNPYGATNPYGSSSDAADRKPRIDPSVQPPPSGLTLQRIPAGSAPADPWAGMSNTRGLDSRSESNATTNPGSAPAPAADQYYQKPTDWAPLPRSTGSTIPGLGSSNGRFTSEDPAATNGGSPTAKFELQPIPNSGTPTPAPAGTAPSIAPREIIAPSANPPIDPYAPVERTERRYQVPPVPSLPPSNDPGQDAPPLLNDSRDRTALMRPIPTRWKANRIVWTASHRTPVAERLVAHEETDERASVERAVLEREDAVDSAVEAPVTPEPRKIDTRRLDATRVRESKPVTLQRFQSDAGDPNSTPWRSVR